MIRVAAVGDLHLGADSRGTMRCHLEHLGSHADVLLLAGDLTKRGEPAEAEVMADELRDCPVPVVAVLGNHDYHAEEEKEVVRILEEAGIVVLDGTSMTLDVDGTRVGIAGVKGFGVGFPGATASDFGEPEMKAFVGHAREHAERLEAALTEVGEHDLRIALLHYAPCTDTLLGEKPEIWAFLGSYLLGEVIDRVGCDVVFHGHAHAGSEHGRTPGGVTVRNVAQPVIGHAYNLYCLGARDGARGCETGPEHPAEVLDARSAAPPHS